MAKYERSGSGVQDPLQNDLNAGGNDLTNVGSFNSELWLSPSDSVADMQTDIDNAGANTLINFETGSYTWDGSLQIYSDSVVNIQSCDVTFASGQTGPMLRNDDFTNGNANISIFAHGSEFDGNRSSLAAGSDNSGVWFRGDDGGQNDPSYFSENCNVYGGEWHDFGKIGLQAWRVVNADLHPDESHHNGEPGDTASGGDGIYAVVCQSADLRGYLHDNERHGSSIAGTGNARSVNCSVEVNAEDNGNDDINVEACEGVSIDQSTSRNGGLDGVHVKGTGSINVDVTGSSNGPLFNVQDYTSTTSYLTGETGGKSMTVDITSINSSSHGVVTRGTGQMTLRPTVIDAAGLGILNSGNVPDLTIEEPHIESTDSYSIYLGNATDITAEVSGGRVDNWDRGANGEGAIGSGNNLGDRCTISGVSVGVAANTSAGGVINLSGGDYHAVTGCATGGQTITVNGSNSITSGNS